MWPSRYPKRILYKEVLTMNSHKDEQEGIVNKWPPRC
jgi:hypothetical protein